LFPITKPGIRIVTIKAFEGTSLKEQDIADAGAIHRPKGLNGMNISLYALQDGPSSPE